MRFEDHFADTNQGFCFEYIVVDQLKQLHFLTKVKLTVFIELEIKPLFECTYNL